MNQTYRTDAELHRLALAATNSDDLTVPERLDDALTQINAPTGVSPADIASAAEQFNTWIRGDGPVMHVVEDLLIAAANQLELWARGHNCDPQRREYLTELIAELRDCASGASK
ncbi:hypothetical protein [Mycolicibacterium peregrinum]|uniref:Uncharacterized protein n=1 Tax=Mycolicibacterium peregrinum TaxID=43304 RepID=A0A4Z0HT38_MYCPR|nr:hypothetical protein [Mycolicibacterium peregrinum]TGB45486.1 hypothetical protein EJD94_00240 [Mycolicibacterium peregrinum]TGB47784.1 hypothetical protein EJD98_02435 [Mycolicibacterium peregrinum]